MNLTRVARVLAGFVAFFTAIQLVPMLLALGEHGPRHDAACGGFEWSFGIGLATAIGLGLVGRRSSGQMFRRETIAVAGSAWFLASVLGALPFWCSGLLTDPADALFETVSGLTTCGGTVLGSAANPKPEDACSALLLWRAMLQWVGGIGIVLLFVALLPAMGSTGKNLLLAESVGVSMEGSQPRILSQARSVMLVYFLLTAACAVSLVAFGNMTWFEAVCHSFTCLATGGFSTRTSIAEFHSLGDEVVLTVFMYLGGCSFTVMAGIVRNGRTGLVAMLRSGEFRLYTLITAMAVGIVTIDVWCKGAASFGSALRQASFNTVSMLSCCGYATSDFHAWPPLSLIVLFTCMLVGGSSGSAAGGMKQVRLLICIKLLAYQIRTFVRPKVVERIQLDEETLAASTMSSVLAMVLLWLCTVLLGGMVIACDQRLSFIGALSTSASMLANVGPGLAMVHPDALLSLPDWGTGIPQHLIVGPNIGPFGGFGDLHDWTKLAMSFEMVLGRLELLPLLALFSPSYWRR